MPWPFAQKRTLRIRPNIGVVDGSPGPQKRTLGVGLAVGPTDVASTTDLYRMADEALYAAKEGGRNQTRCATRAWADTSAVVQLRSVHP